MKQKYFDRNLTVEYRGHISSNKKTGWETLLPLGLLELGRQDSSLRSSAPKAPATQNATAPMRNK